MRSALYKVHFNRIASIRQEKLACRAAEEIRYADHEDELYREDLPHGATLCLQERFYELRSRSVENIDQLKKLVYICKQIHELKIPLDPDKAIKDKILKDLAGHPFDRLMAKYGTALFTGKEEDLPPRTREARRAAQMQAQSQSANAADPEPAGSDPEEGNHQTQPPIDSPPGSLEQNEGDLRAAA